MTVIIPAFNCAQWIGQAIDSVLNQSIPATEIVVIDDGSTDTTAAVLAGYGRQIICLRQSNQGVAAARNAGLNLAGGEAIAFLDGDDVWHPRKLELQLRVMADDSTIGLLGTGRFIWPATAVPHVPGEQAAAVTRIDRNALAVKNYLATSSVMVRRELIRQVGGFDTTLHGPEDHDYWLRIAGVATVAILPVPLMGYRSVQGSLSKRAGTMEAGMQRILRKLDGQDYWRGNRLLRHRAYSYVNYSSAYLHGAAGKRWIAISRLLASLAWYPLPYRRAESGASFGRIRRLAVSLLRLVGVVKTEPAL